MDWGEVLFGSSETDSRTPVLASLVASFVVVVGYLTGVFGAASFLSWGLPQPPLVATLAALMLSAGIAYVRSGFIPGLAGSCGVFLSTGVVDVFFRYRGFTVTERLDVLLDLGFLLVSWGCVFGCLGWVSGVVLRHHLRRR